MHSSSHRRINVVGTSGSGKSTVARALSERLGVPHIEMDRLFWKPDWQESTDEELFERVEEVTRQSEWVLDGNYGRTVPIKWKNVQLVVWIDLSFARTVYQVTCRSLKRSFSKEEIWPDTGNRETLTKTFLSKDSIILWAITTHHKNRRRYLQMMQDPKWSHVEFVRLRSRREVEAWLESVG